MTNVVIRMGQSNSCGQADNDTLDDSFKQTFSNIKTWRGQANGFASLDWSTNNNRYPTEAALGASEFAILKGLQELKGGTIYDIKYGVGGTYLGTSQSSAVNWNTSTKGSYFNSATSTINDAMNYLWNTLGLRTFTFYIFWDQGESDSRNATDTANYQTNLTNFITAIRNNIGISSANKYFINPRVNTSLPTSGTGAITGATNADPIVITQASHGLASGMTVTISGVLGNTAANGTFVITVINANTYSLNGAVGNGARTGGGTVDSWTGLSTIKSAQTTLCSTISQCYGCDCEGFELQADNLHYTNLGYKDKGEHVVNNIIIPNGL